MRRSIRSSLFLLVVPFALTFTLLAWVVSSKVGPWMAQPLVANCADKGYPQWFCDLQAGLVPWLLLGAGILILLTVTASLSLGLFRAHLKELQQDVLDFQKGHRGHLSPDAPSEMGPLVQLLNRILKAGAERHSTDSATDHDSLRESLRSDQAQTMATRERSPLAARFPPAEPMPERPATRTDSTTSEPQPKPRPEPSPEPRPEPKPEPRPEPEHRHQPARKQPEPPPVQRPTSRQPVRPEDLEVSLEQLDADINKALNEPEPAPEPRTKPEPEPEPEPERKSTPEPSSEPEPERAPKSEPRPEPEPQEPNAAAQPETATRNQAEAPDDDSQERDAPRQSKNLAYPSRKCRKLIAMLGQRYPDINFELITDVAETDPWTIREADLTEIFGQLLDNAGKWAESQVNVFLAIKGNMLVFGVADDGPGVDSEVASHLGEPGFKVNPDQPAGNGLVTVRRVMDAHGGSLAFDRSRLGGLEAIAAIPGSPVPRHVFAKGAFH